MRHWISGLDANMRLEGLRGDLEHEQNRPFSANRVTRIECEIRTESSLYPACVKVGATAMAVGEYVDEETGFVTPYGNVQLWWATEWYARVIDFLPPGPEGYNTSTNYSETDPDLRHSTRTEGAWDVEIVDEGERPPPESGGGWAFDYHSYRVTIALGGETVLETTGYWDLPPTRVRINANHDWLFKALGGPPAIRSDPGAGLDWIEIERTFDGAETPGTNRWDWASAKRLVEWTKRRGQLTGVLSEGGAANVDTDASVVDGMLCAPWETRSGWAYSERATWEYEIARLVGGDAVGVYTDDQGIHWTVWIDDEYQIQVAYKSTPADDGWASAGAVTDGSVAYDSVDISGQGSALVVVARDAGDQEAWSFVSVNQGETWSGPHDITG